MSKREKVKEEESKPSVAVSDKMAKAIVASGEDAKKAAAQEVMADPSLAGPSAQTGSVVPLAQALTSKIEAIKSEVESRLTSAQRYISDAEFQNQKQERYRRIGDLVTKFALDLVGVCPPGDYIDAAIRTLDTVQLLACAEVSIVLKPTVRFPDSPFPSGGMP